MLVASPHGYAGDVDVAVGHGHQAQILLNGRLAPRRKLGHRTDGSRLRHLAARVGVHLRIHHQHVDVAPAGQDVIQAAIADVVGPAVAADDPHALFDQVIGQGAQVLQAGFEDAVSPVEAVQPAVDALFQQGHPFPLIEDVGLGGLGVAEDGVGQIPRQGRVFGIQRQGVQQFAGLLDVLI